MRSHTTHWRGRLLALLLLAGMASTAHAALFGGKKPEAALIEWLEGLGGEVNVAIEARGGGPRGTYARVAVPHHGLLARVPLKGAIWFPATYDDFSELGAMVALEAVNASSEYAPYLNAVPAVLGAAHSASFETFPPEYLHLVRSDLMAGHITGTQQTTLKFWAKRGAELILKGVTLDRLRGALSAIATRYFGITHRGVTASVMIPLLDFANHEESCANYYEYLPCAYDGPPPLTLPEDADLGPHADADAVERGALCAFWRAGRAYAPGDEVCNRYGYMAPDQSLFQYGFLLPQDPPDMARMDGAEYTGEHVYGALAHADPVQFDGHADALRDEAARVAARITELEGLAPAEAATAPAPGDAGGRLLAGLKGLRLQRVKALRSELARLERRLAEKEGAERGSGKSASASGSDSASGGSSCSRCGGGGGGSSDESDSSSSSSSDGGGGKGKPCGCKKSGEGPSADDGGRTSGDGAGEL